MRSVGANGNGEFRGILTLGVILFFSLSIIAIASDAPPPEMDHLAELRDAAGRSIMTWFAAGSIMCIVAFAQQHYRLIARETAWVFWIIALAAIAKATLLATSEGMHGDHLRGWLLIVFFWLSAWLFVDFLSTARFDMRFAERARGLVIPIVFGTTLLVLWEGITRGANVPTVLLPPPSMIGERFAASTQILWADFKQTFLQAVLIGYALGCGSAFAIAIAIDRSPFLQRGLLPVGNLVSALPIIGIAPIMVMWFGFDWPSKAAVVIVMTFFPTLVNTVQGLQAAETMQRDLMHTYAASYWQTLFKLRLPAAAPFIFNALKICSTLALIGAIVAEFFGTPIVGMGFRISTGVGRMDVDLVWAEIAVAALAGSAFYGMVVLIERAVTFWHPSVRGQG